MRRRLPALSMLVVLAVAAIALALGSGGEVARKPSPASASNAAGPAAADERPARPRRAQVVEPVAGESAATAALPVEEAGDQAPADGPGATPAPASSTPRSRSKHGTGPTSDAAVSEADVLKNGIALPPIEAPDAVRQIIEAGNYIARTPYLWGGGHGKWLDKGYDCSGSISYALARAGLLNAPQDSGRLMSWGAPGKGKWITIYANPGHVYMVVAGVRFDTSGQRSNGSRWQNVMRPGGGFEARHPPGL